MKHATYTLLALCIFLFQCKDKSPVQPSGPTRDIDVLEFTVPGIDSKNITIKDNIIVVNLPENYAGGNIIKPLVTLETGYTSQSPILNGFDYEDKFVRLEVQSSITLDYKQYKIIVVPFNAVKLAEPAKDYNIKIQADASISVPVILKGTSEAVNDSNNIVTEPKILFEDKVTGKPSEQFSTDISIVDGITQVKLKFPVIVSPGEYRAYVVWGTQKELLSDHISVSAGPLQLRKGAWNMLPNSKHFEVSGYNISKDSKYEVTIENDFIEKRTLKLYYKDAGTLSGDVPEDITTGNYKATYLENGKAIKSLDFEMKIQNLIEFDNFYIRSLNTQPILKILSQPSKSNSVKYPDGFSVDYLEPIVEVSRDEPLLAYIVRSEPGFPDRNDLVLRNIDTKKEYTIAYSGDNGYGLFDGFVFFLGYKIDKDIPAGKYESYVIIGPNNEKSEKYSQIIAIE